MRDLVAYPGCFPTAAILALAPLAPYLTDVVIDAKTGVSGAGRAATEKHALRRPSTRTSRPMASAVIATCPRSTRSWPRWGRATSSPRSRPHLLPLDQGELVSCYATLDREVDAAALYEERYGDERFVELVDHGPGRARRARDELLPRPGPSPIARTGKVFVFAAIDNLWKGTASQAVQNLNLMFGLDEATGLVP